VTIRLLDCGGADTGTPDYKTYIQLFQDGFDNYNNWLKHKKEQERRKKMETLKIS